jgi:uncharacterized protein (TIGR02246 family)
MMLKGKILPVVVVTKIASMLVVGAGILLVLGSVASFASPVDEATAMISRWTSAYNANDVEGLVKLYTPDAVVLGTRSPIISQGPQDTRAYFLSTHLPGSGNKVEFGERRMMVLGDLRAVLVTGFYNFTLNIGGKITPSHARFTWLIVNRGGQWLIAHHHSSAVPAAPQ